MLCTVKLNFRVHLTRSRSCFEGVRVVVGSGIMGGARGCGGTTSVLAIACSAPLNPHNKLEMLAYKTYHKVNTMRRT